MGDSTFKTNCRICEQEVHPKWLGLHTKRIHQISFYEYVQLYRSDFPKYKNCEVCGIFIPGTSPAKNRTCSRECMSKLRKTWTGDKSPRYGISCSQETKDKIGKAAIQRLKDGQVHPRLGKKFTQETKDKLRIAALINAAKPEYKNGMTGKTHTPEAIQKIFAHRKMNRLEKVVADILDANQIQYIFQFFINVNGICKSYDFKLTDSNIILEIDGDFWHGNKTSKTKFHKYKTVQENDKLKTNIAIERGYKLLRFWQSDIKTDPYIIINTINRTL